VLRGVFALLVLNWLPGGVFGLVAVDDMLSAVEPPGSALLGGSLFGRAPKK
jgi:hypothetical protein